LSVRVFSARVRAGDIVPEEGVELPEGARVTVVTDSESDDFDLTPAEEADLIEALGEADCGEVISAHDLLKRLAG
jgi:hypothetical protein